MDTDMALSSSETSGNPPVTCLTGDVPHDARATAQCSLNTQCPSRNLHILPAAENSLPFHLQLLNSSSSFRDTMFYEEFLSFWSRIQTPSSVCPSISGLFIMGHCNYLSGSWESLQSRYRHLLGCPCHSVWHFPTKIWKRKSKLPRCYVSNGSTVLKMTGTHLLGTGTPEARCHFWVQEHKTPKFPVSWGTLRPGTWRIFPSLHWSSQSLRRMRLRERIP